MRIRASMAGDKVEVRVLMSHEMETGLRKDANGAVVPAHFIQNVTVTHAGKTVLSAQWGHLDIEEPFHAFPVQRGKPGEKVTISWVDNMGERRTDEVVIGGG